MRYRFQKHIAMLDSYANQADYNKQSQGEHVWTQQRRPLILIERSSHVTRYARHTAVMMEK
jgi:hypothetical protein